MVSLRRPRPDPLPAQARAIINRLEPAAPADLRGYLRTHARRYAWTMEYLTPLIAERRWASTGRALRILDVGPSFQTFLLKEMAPEAEVQTIGFYDPHFFDVPPEEGDDRLRLPSESHVSFDLNNAVNADARPTLADFDLILMAETIEHLHVGPGPVLRFLASGLRPDGFLVVQTPNAVALHKRVWMAIGRSPIAPLPDNRPGEAHLHEYTIAELLAGGDRAGLEPVDISSRNYIGGTWPARGYGLLGRMLPTSLRDGVAVTFRVAATK